MSKKRKSFILHYDSLNVLDDLTNEQAGLLFKAIKAYHLNEDFELDALTNIAMSPFRNQFERDAEKYAQLCEKNRKIAEARHSTKATTGKNGNQPLPKTTKSTDNDNDSDSDSDSDSKSDSDINKTKRKVKTLLPSDFEITDQMRSWYSSQSFSMLIEPTTDKWKDAMMAGGYKYLDWVAAWRNGMKKAQEWHGKNNQQPKRPKEFSQ